MRVSAAAPQVTVLDASAVLAVLNGEPGADRVIAALPGAAISAVNLAEVSARLVDHRVPDAQISRVIAALGLRVEAFGSNDAERVARLRRATRSQGLSLGGRACLALAVRLAALVLTADRAWSAIDVGVTIEQIR